MTDETLPGTVPGGVETDLFPWWLVVLQGFVTLMLGLFLLMQPGMTLLVLVTFIGIYWFITGIFAIVSLVLDRTDLVWKAIIAVLGIIAGILVTTYPLYSTVLIATFFAILIAVWGILIGITSLARGVSGGGCTAAVLGILSIIIGIILLARPLLTAASLVLILGVFAVIGGVMAIVAGIRMRR
ncbi:HdeD family acid-resistance protein [Methanofollis fontis]|uniref:HdeD family acid-resistance protein n=1 Tax=Methanofollis fontis TaxID=2052832 RepID=A0A483CWA2_9EURY|nr:DUF308 domain-containing protein [Methanofollis fontis]TAJ45857.1 hypothetical protein CUJ86_01675 [Methanofollis fontis]